MKSAPCFISVFFSPLFHSLLFQKGTKVFNLFFAKHQQMGFCVGNEDFLSKTAQFVTEFCQEKKTLTV
jgi:hypothetical protein